MKDFEAWVHSIVEPLGCVVDLTLRFDKGQVTFVKAEAIEEENSPQPEAHYIG